MALASWDAGRCPNCGNYDVLVPLKANLRDVTWEEHGGRMVAVAQYRCIACGAADLIRRDFNARHENQKPQPGVASPSDGRMFVARPIDEPSP